jgi:hypothetical protein
MIGREAKEKSCCRFGCQTGRSLSLRRSFVYSVGLDLAWILDGNTKRGNVALPLFRFAELVRFSAN